MKGWGAFRHLKGKSFREIAGGTRGKGLRVPVGVARTQNDLLWEGANSTKGYVYCLQRKEGRERRRQGRGESAVRNGRKTVRVDVASDGGAQLRGGGGVVRWAEGLMVMESRNGGVGSSGRRAAVWKGELLRGEECGGPGSRRGGCPDRGQKTTAGWAGGQGTYSGFGGRHRFRIWRAPVPDLGGTGSGFGWWGRV